MPHPTDHSDPSSRRQFLRAVALSTAGLIGSAALGDSQRLFALPALSDLRGPDPEAPNDQVAAIIRDIAKGRPVRSGHVSLDMPLVAEDGRVVPVIVESDLPMTRTSYVRGVHLIVDHNPDPHLAVFHLTPAAGRVSLSTRIKMKRTTWVRALLDTTNDGVWAGYARVQVSLNGCG